MNDRDLLTVEELARLLRVSPSAIHSQRHRGEKPGALGFALGRRIFYRRSDLDNFIDELIARDEATRVSAGKL